MGYQQNRGLLRVTVIDASNLPPMDMNGKADPYIEVSLRPGQKKFTTSIKTYCLNPTFNETEDFSVTQNEMENSELVLKVMDSDFPQADELIGVIRLPLKSLDLKTVKYDDKHISNFLNVIIKEG